MFKEIKKCQELIMNFRQYQTKSYNILAAKYGQDFAKYVGRSMIFEDVRLAVRPASELLDAVFVDDVKEGVGAPLMVETSKDNWQAHFVMDQICDEEEILKIQKELTRFFGGDTGAARKNQPRRLPVPGLRMRVNRNWKLSKEKLLLKYEVFFEPAPKKEAQFRESRERNCGEMDTVNEDGSRILSKSVIRDIWQRKWDRNNKDDSAADFGLATYLVENRGYGVEEVIAAIEAARDNLAQDKGAHAEWYLQHTAEKAFAEIERRREKQR